MSILIQDIELYLQLKQYFCFKGIQLDTCVCVCLGYVCTSVCKGIFSAFIKTYEFKNPRITTVVFNLNTKR